VKGPIRTWHAQLSILGFGAKVSSDGGLLRSQFGSEQQRIVCPMVPYVWVTDNSKGLGELNSMVKVEEF